MTLVAFCSFMAFASPLVFAQAPTSGRSPAAATANNRGPAQAAEVKDAPATPNSQQVSSPEIANDKTGPEITDGVDKHWLINAIFSPADMWIAGKYGLSITYMADAFRDFELEYLRGSFSTSFLGEDLGEAIEQKITIKTRYFIND